MQKQTRHISVYEDGMNETCQLISGCLCIY
jgi:hypothetical protein